MRKLPAKACSIPVALLCLFSLLPIGRGQLNLSGSEEIKLALDKLNVLGSVLMIAAHPDDENNFVLAYYGRGRKVETAYLSATRGEGGQNLIGSEQGELLGLIRTQELLAARRVDGAQQYFTRAIDFGFSKTAAETLQKWDHDKILSDMVWVIRQFQPDVVIQQWSGTPRDGHGHHQASGILGREAVIAAADPKRFPQQLQWVKPWQVKRMVGRTGGFVQTPAGARPAGAAPSTTPPSTAPPSTAPPSTTPPQPGGRGQRGGRNQPAPEGPTPGQIQVDTGEFDPVLGKSYTEIGAISRTQHESQGQGSAQRKGSAASAFVVLSGDKAEKDIFEGIDITWHRVPGGDDIGRKLAEAAAHFDMQHPDKTIAALLDARPAIAKLAAAKNTWGVRKLQELDDTAALCAGLWLQAEASEPLQTPGGHWKLNLIALDRAHVAIGPVSVRIDGFGKTTTEEIAATLAYNRPSSKTVEIAIPADAPYSQPFWLARPREGDTYVVKDQRLIGRADLEPVLQATFTFTISGQELTIAKPARFRYVDQIEGEKRRPLVLAPAVAVNLVNSAIVFPSSAAKEVPVEVRSLAGKVSGSVRLTVPDGWKVQPASSDFQLGAAGEEQQYSFSVTPPASAHQADFHAIATVNGKELSTGIRQITYSHIPPQTVFPDAAGSLRPAPLTILAKKVGYVAGAGDQVPDAIRQMGCDVTFLTDEELAGGNLASYDAIVTGVRAYDLRDGLRANQLRLLNYVKNGGTLIVQYNRLKTAAEHMGPFPITLDPSGRVTVEDAPVAFTNTSSVLLNRPNKITQADFEGWIQERGAYFPSKWDPRYETVIESHDPGEKPLPGGLLMAKYGKGVYIFTGYAWFRQLPAGVPGAYRIFANLLSAGKVAAGH